MDEEKKAQQDNAEQQEPQKNEGPKKKKFGPVKTSLCIVSAAAVAAVGVWAGVAFGRPQRRNDPDEGYGSVVYEVEEGERFSPSAFVSQIKERDENGNAVSGSEDTYDAVDVFGRLNWTFSQQGNWSSEMHSEVHTAIGLQEVATYKRFADGILISADITTSSMINVAREYCYIGDRVIWRESSENKSQWDGINTAFSEKAPSGNMNISGEDGFKKRNGLPATELSVYVIEGNTVESAELNTVSRLADGESLFTLEMHLLAKTDEEGKTGAAAYYGNQMVFTGGIDAPPEFKYITLSYTFTEDWQVVSCDVAEEYTASMKTIVSTCSSTSRTEYSYDVEGLEEEVKTVYGDYYEQYAEQEATGSVERPVTAADCLASAFGAVLTRPTTLNVALTVDEEPVPAVLYLDLGGFSVGESFDISQLEARLSVGSTLDLYLKGGTAYVRYSDVKLSMSLDELTAMLGGAQTMTGETEGTQPDLLEELMGGTFTYDEATARLSSAIHLAGIPLTLDFHFTLDADKNAALSHLDAACELQLSTEQIALDSAVSANITFGTNPPALPTAQELAEYTDLATYITRLTELFTADVLRLEVGYTDEASGLAVTGHADVDTTALTVLGDFTIEYQEKTKPIRVQYDGTAVYADIDGLKLKATNEDLAALLAALAPPAELAEEGPTVLPLGSVFGTLLDEEFAGSFASAAVGDALQLTIDGTALLKDLLPDIDLGDIVLTVDENALSLSVLDAQVSLEKGTAFTLSTDGYAGVREYVETVLGLVESSELSVELSYAPEEGGVSLAGSLTVGLSEPYTANGQLTLTVSKTQYTLGLLYDGAQLGVELNGVKLKGSTETLASLVALFIGEETPTLPDVDVTLEELLTKLFSVKFNELIPQLSDENGVLKAVLSTDAILSLFDSDLKLGEVSIDVSKEAGTVSVAASDVTLSVGTADEPPVVDLTGYASADGLAEGIAAIVNAKGVSLNGSFEVLSTETSIAVLLENAAISWKNGFEMRFDLVLSADGLHHRVEVYVSGERVTLAYGEVGAELVFADFEDLKAAFEGLKTKVQAIIDGVKGTGTQPQPVPEEAAAAIALAENGDALAALMEKLEAFLAELGVSQDGQLEVDVDGILSMLTIFAPEDENALLGVSFGDVSLLVLGAEGSEIGLRLVGGEYAVGEATASARTEPLDQMPEINYLSKEGYLALIDHLGAAVDLLTADDYTFSITGSTTFKSLEPATTEPAVPETEATEDAGAEATETEETQEVTRTRYSFEATVKYHNGADVPVHLDVDKQSLWIETSLFLNVHLALVAGDGAGETDKSLYLDLFLLDAAPSKDENGSLVTDGNLDIYLSLSQFGPDTTEVGSDNLSKYKPLNIYAPADEILTLLSSGVAALGLDIDLLDNYLVSKWLEIDTVAQLQAFTPIIQKLLGGLLEGLGFPQKEPAPEETPAESALLAETGDTVYLKQLSATQDELRLVLNSAAVYGAEGIEDLSVTLTRGEDGKFSTLALANIYDGTATEKTELTGEFDYTAVTPDIPEGSYTSFVGAEKLLLSLIRSATHAESTEVISGEEAQHTYAVNNNFYIQGSVKANVITDITIDIIAISVTIDENGDLGINVRLKYKGAAALIVVINGDSTLDLTIKNGMIYMKRVQTTEQKTFSNDPLPTSITLYRAMPMSSFTADILGSFSFVLNLNQRAIETIMGWIPGGSTDPEPEEVVDYGARLSEVLKNYTYTAAGQDAEGNKTPAKWDLTLNGDAFVKGILGDIHIVIEEGTDGFIRGLRVNLTVVKFITASLDLRWCNAGGSMEEGATDLTEDVSAEIQSSFGAMLDKLNTVENEKNGWDDPATEEKEGPAFLEAKETTVTFRVNKLDGSTQDLSTQSVFVSTGADGNRANTLYSELTYPALPAETPEFKYAWPSTLTLGNEIPANNIILATESKKLYSVKLTSDSDLGEGWEQDGDVWTHTAEMEYGAKIVAGSQEFTVTDTETEFLIKLEYVPTVGSRAGHWQKNPEITAQGMQLIPEYDADTIVYKSDVAFTAEGVENATTEHTATFGTTYTLITPQAEGHTFLGWFMKNAEGKWVEVKTLELGAEVATTEVEALWAKTQYGFSMSGNRSGRIGSYTYSVSIVETQEELVGAFANEEINRSVKREFYIGTGTPGYEVVDGTTLTKSVSAGFSTVKANVRVTVTYTDENGNELLTIVVEHSGSFNGITGSFSQSS